MVDNVCSLSPYGCLLIGKIDANQVRLRTYRRRRPLGRHRPLMVLHIFMEKRMSPGKDSLKSWPVRTMMS